MGKINVDYDVLNQKGSPAWYSDLFANIPTPGYTGRMFISTDTFAFYRDNGSGWDLTGGPGIGTITGSGVSGQVSFFSGTQVLGGSTNLIWDNTNNRLGINTNTPTTSLDIHTTGNAAIFNGTGTNNAFLTFANAGVNKWYIGNNYNAAANDYQIFDVTNSIARLTIKNTGASTLIGTFTATSLIKSGGTSSQILLADGSTTPTSTFGAGSVTSVSALTLGTTGTDLTSSVVNSTTTPVITLNVPTASATNRGALSSADWTTFNNKQATLSLTTTGTSGAATLVGATLNIPNYTNVGTVTSVAALTLGTTGTDLSSSVANSTTTPVITLNVPTASATNRGALSSADFTTFNNKQATISVTAPVVLTGATISMPAATTSVNGYLTSTDWNTFNNKTSNLGTVTDVVALTIGTTGIDITSTAVTTTTTPVITLNIPTASASNRGALSSTDWTIFNNKQATLSLTTTGTSGVATLVANTLNVPNYGSGAVTGSGTTNYIPKFTSASAIGNSVAYDNGTQIGISQTTLFTKFSVADSLAATSVGSNYNPGIVNIQNTNTTNGNLSLIGFQDATSFINLAAFGAINEVHSGSPNNVKGSLAFYTKTNGTSYVTEKMRLDASGILGIGGAINTGYSLNYLLQIGAESGNTGLIIRMGTSSIGKLSFDKGTNGDGIGRIWYDASNNSMQFYTSSNGTNSNLAFTLDTNRTGVFVVDANINSLTIGKGTNSLSYNTAFGIDALLSATTGNFNVAIGHSTLKANTTGNYNVAIGSESLFTNTIGIDNVGLGTQTLLYNTTGSNNVAIGSGAMAINITGSNNTAIGYGAMGQPTTGSNKTAVGYLALGYATGTNNIGIGYQSGFGITTGTYNHIFGSNIQLSTGSFNTILGYMPTSSITTGSYNTIIGNANGLGDVSNNIALADGQGNIRYHWNGTNTLLGLTGDFGIGTNTPPNLGATNTTLTINGNGGNAGILNLQYAGTNGMFVYSDGNGTTQYETRNLYMRFGTNNTERIKITSAGELELAYSGGAGVIRSEGIYSNTSANVPNMYIGSAYDMGRGTASSIRYKENINDWGGNGLDTILALKPKTFTYKEEYYKHPERVILGLIAEEVAETCKYLADYENEDGSGQVENVRYAYIVVPLIKAIQELNEKLIRNNIN